MDGYDYPMLQFTFSNQHIGLPQMDQQFFFLPQREVAYAVARLFPHKLHNFTTLLSFLVLQQSISPIPNLLPKPDRPFNHFCILKKLINLAAPGSFNLGIANLVYKLAVQQNIMISEQVNYTSLYTEDELNELKTNMEIEIGATISKVRYYSRKSQKTTDVRFVCKERKGHGCPFQYVFQEVQHGRFALLSHQHEHQNLCYFDDETKAFLYSRSRLIKMKPLIEDFVHRRDALRLHERPLVLLTLMNREFGDGEGNFFECGVASQESKTKLKKKFDNIVNEIRFARRKESQSNTNSDVASKSSLKSEKQVALPLTVPETSPKVKEQQKKCGFISTATTLDEPTSTEADVKRLTAFTPVKAERPQYLGFPSATVLQSPFQPYFIYNGLLTPFPTAYAFPFPYYN